MLVRFRFTVRNRFKSGGFTSSKPIKKVQLSPHHRASRQQFYSRHDRLTRKEWLQARFFGRVTFLPSKDRRSYPSLASRDRHLAPTVQPTIVYNGGSAMVWTGISANGYSIFQGDNTRPHRTQIVDGFLRQN